MRPEHGKVEGIDLNRDDMGERVAADYSNRKMVSSAEGSKIVTAKGPRKGETIYAEMCGRLAENEESNRERSEDSEAWSTVV